MSATTCSACQTPLWQLEFQQVPWPSGTKALSIIRWTWQSLQSGSWLPTRSNAVQRSFDCRRGDCDIFDLLSVNLTVALLFEYAVIVSDTSIEGIHKTSPYILTGFWNSNYRQPKELRFSKSQHDLLVPTAQFIIRMSNPKVFVSWGWKVANHLPADNISLFPFHSIPTM